MTQEEKQLLLADLCARLPYGINVLVSGEKYFGEEKESYIEELVPGSYLFESDVILKPYLRPMSSMTEEEKNEIKALGAEFSSIGSIRFRIEEKENDGFEYGYKWLDILDFLNAHHFDYRGLIPMGLALEAPEGMYNV